MTVIGKIKHTFSLLSSLVFLLLCPFLSLAQTTGPASPETVAFTSVGSDNLVDLSTGDFSYSIPLMTVPGPNGGYPIVLGYQGGVSMTQESSWVGLGWNLNVGSINRNLRGLPDDFKGDEVNQGMNYKKNITNSLDLNINTLLLILGKKEYFGQKLEVGNSVSIHHNSFLGLGFGFGGSFEIGHFSMNTTFDSKDGIAISPRLSTGKLMDNFRLSLGAGFSTSQGFNNISFGGSASKSFLRIPFSAGANFAKNAPIGEISMAQTIESGNGGFGFGTYSAPKYGEYANLRGNQTKVFLSQNSIDVKSYGYLYLEHTDSLGLMDFHKENNLSSFNHSPVMYLPVLDNDVFTVTGQGITGSFRAYRNDVPLLKPQTVTSTKTSGGGAVEYGATTHLGVDANWGKGKSMTGAWGVNGQHDGQMAANLEDEIHLQSEDLSKPLYQPFYFDFMGKQTRSDESGFQNIKGNIPIKYPLAKSGKLKYKSMWSKYGELSTAAFNKGIKTDINKERNITTNHIAYRTKAEMTLDLSNHPGKYNHIYSANTAFPMNGSKITYDDAIGKAHHINEMTVYNTSGTKYVYGLPAYNLEKEEVVFSVDHNSSDPFQIDYDLQDASTGNTKGLENFYKSTKIKDYVYSYLLTATYSDDYVDLKGDGPSDDDFGYWCKFNYSKINSTNEIAWRAPVWGANYEEGNYSDTEDNKAAFTYGRKQQYFLHSVETKTHVAIFETDFRADNRGVSDRDQQSTTPLGEKTKRLKSIKLYSKNDPNYGTSNAVPIKEVHFQQDYSLCRKTPNSDSNQKGKLTLNKLYFKYQGNSKGEKTPYTFKYGFNPDYKYLAHTDRWGNYQDQPAGFTAKTFPFTNQGESQTTRNQYTSAWNLTKINLPSKGSLEIEYESDDYAYVQNKKAGQMFEVVGLSDGIKSSTNDLIGNFEIGGNICNYVYFKGNINSLSDVQEAVNDLTHIYFKTYVHLKGVGANKKNEYIQGYAEIDQGKEGFISGTNIGYVKLKNAVYGNDSKLVDIHPFQKAACQHYHDRVDLQTAVQSPIKQVRILFGGPVRYYKEVNKLCSELELSDAQRKSLIRLNNPIAKKYGGGHRVKSIKVNTGWGETYGQKYSYTNEDGSSSGVADYEPTIGGNENSLKVPVNYKGVLDYNSYKGRSQFFVEKPFCEAYYPAPIIRYGRIITEGLTPYDIGITLSDTISNLGGITVNEFYTAKDFPVFESHSDRDEIPHFREAIAIPFGLDRPFQSSKAFSQGFVVELNDMSGKPKSVSTYNYTSKGNLTASNQKTKVEYIYHTHSSTPSKLDGEVLVINQDGEFETATIGRKEEFYVHQQEDFDYNQNHSISVDFATSSPTNIDYLIPSYQRNRSIQQRRMLVTNKVIYRTGILKEIRTNDNGRKTVATNLAYDTFTGEALIQSQENDWDSLVYSYNYAGHWKYPALAGKYQNYRAAFIVKGNSPDFSIDTDTPVEEVLQVGDMLQVGSSNPLSANQEVYVTKVDPVTNTFNAGLPIKYNFSFQPFQAGDTLKVMESGYRNLQSVKVGSLVSLKNPIYFDYPDSGLFDHFFQIIKTGIVDYGTYISNCDTLDYLYHGGLNSVVGNVKTIVFNITSTKNGECSLFIKYNTFGNSNLQLTQLNITANSLEKITPQEYKFSYTYNQGNEILKGSGTISTDCDLACPIEGILHASATELTDDWTYNYIDEDNPEVASGITINNGNLNPYAFGKKGNWKAERSWVNQINRKQKGILGQDIEIDTDGEYETFKFFNWYLDLGKNEKNKWAWANEMTQYSPFGFSLENKNALDIYSAQLYGYDNSTVIAVAANADYQEIAFDDFETRNDLVGSQTVITHGSNHNFTGHFTGSCSITDWSAHTGEFSMFIPSAGYLLENTLDLEVGKDYVFSAWYRVRGGYGGDISVMQQSTTLASIAYQLNTHPFEVIDGWTKMEMVFRPTSNAPVKIAFNAPPGGFLIIDDIRIHPFNAAFKSFVYDPNTLKMIAELDNHNYAQFYNFDEEGKLIQIKKETERGIMTIQSSRDNIAH